MSQELIEVLAIVIAWLIAGAVIFCGVYLIGNQPLSESIGYGVVGGFLWVWMGD